MLTDRSAMVGSVFGVWLRSQDSIRTESNRIGGAFVRRVRLLTDAGRFASCLSTAMPTLSIPVCKSLRRRILLLAPIPC